MDYIFYIIDAVADSVEDLAESVATIEMGDKDAKQVRTVPDHPVNAEETPTVSIAEEQKNGEGVDAKDASHERLGSTGVELETLLHGELQPYC